MINWFSQLEWQNPWMLLLLGILPFLWLRRIRNEKSQEVELVFPTLMHLPERSSWKIYLLRILPYFMMLALGFFILALARPQWVLREEKIEADGIDIFLVMDLSSSMLSQDFKPNRLEVSKLVAKDFIDKRSYDRIGLVGFSGEGFTQCPLTVDHNVLNHLLGQLECGFLEDGTAIGMGLSTAVNRLKDDSLTSSKVIILITDGVNNAGEISPDLAAELAKVYRIKIYSIGVGSTGEAYSPIGRQANGEFVFGMAPVNIDESLLTKISSYTGGKYYRATNTDQLKEIYSEIDALEKTKIEVKTYRRYSDEFRPFVLVGVILILLQWLLGSLLNPLMPLKDV